MTLKIVIAEISPPYNGNKVYVTKAVQKKCGDLSESLMVQPIHIV
jgi:hypothetical protein